MQAYLNLRIGSGANHCQDVDNCGDEDHCQTGNCCQDREHQNGNEHADR